MNKVRLRIITAFLVFSLFLGMLSVSGKQTVYAANFQFITGIGLAYGENAYEELEGAGYRVMSVGLNYGVDDASQIYLGYRINQGAPVTNIIITSNVGGSFVSAEGIQYVAAGGPDVDEGTGASGGVVYYTTDPAAGEPLVGLDILRQDVTDGKELLAIQNDGSEVVRNAEGVPADLESGNGNVIIYLEQIRDHIVRPFIREIVTITKADRQSAVFEAAVQGYHYFIDGDIDDDASVYTILAYRRTSNPDEAITNIVGVSEDLRRILEEKQVKPGSEDQKKDSDESVREAAEEPETMSLEPAAEEPVEESEAAEPAPEENAVEPAPEENAGEPVTEEIAGEPEIAEVGAGENAEPEVAESLTGEPEVLEVGAEEFNAGPEEAEVEVAELVGEPEAAEVGAGENASEPEGAAPEDAEPEAPAADEAPTETETASANAPDAEESNAGPEEVKEPEVRLTAEALDISGIEYVCANKEPIPGSSPWNLYVTHDRKAGNPVSMLYAEIAEGGKRTFLGMWADGFFAAKGSTRAYTYVVNEDLLAELQKDRTVYAELPVPMFNGTWDEQARKVNTEVRENAVKLSLLTKSEGLPAERLMMNGLKKPEAEAPVIERTDADSRQNSITSSAFESRENRFLIFGLIAGIVMAVSAAAVMLAKKRKEKGGKKNP